MLILRPANLFDIPALERWDIDPDVIASSGPADAASAFDGIGWREELASQSEVSRHYIADLDGRPIGAMLIIDPQLEPTHYWGECAPNLRAVDIWIGDAADRNCGHGGEMMRLALDICFADAAVTAVLIDPLVSNVDALRFYQRLGFTVVGHRVFGDDNCLVHQLTRAAWRNGA